MAELHIILFIVQISAFTIFDLWGYPPHEQGKWSWYRWAQGFFQVLTYLIVLLLSNWLVSLACFVFWWTGGCDVLYYWIGSALGREGYEFWAVKRWHWLWWTFLGFFQFIPKFILYYKTFSFYGASQMARSDVRFTSDIVFTQAFVGVICSCIILVFS